MPNWKQINTLRFYFKAKKKYQHVLQLQKTKTLSAKNKIQVIYIRKRATASVRQSGQDSNAGEQFGQHTKWAQGKKTTEI